MDIEKYFKIENTQFALMVVDMQNDYCHPDGVFYKHGLRLEGIDLMTERIIETVLFCRSHKIPVIYAGWVIHCDSDGRPVDAGLYPESRSFISKEGLRKGSWGADIISELPTPDFLIEKIRPSCFFNTHLEALLGGLNTSVLIFTGLFTNQCIETSAREAWARDIRFIILENCTMSYDIGLHHAALRSLSLLGQIMTKEVFEKTFLAYRRANSQPRL